MSQIDLHDLPLYFGVVCRRNLGQNQGSILPFILRLMDNQKGLSKLWRTCYELVCWIGSNWEEKFLLVEFAYNNSFYSNIGIVPFEALHGRKCRSPICWDEVGERKLLGPELVQITTEKIKLIREHLRTAQSRQKSYVDQCRLDLEFQVGDYLAF